MDLLFQVKIWFQNHRYKCKRQAKEKAMAEQNQHNQVTLRFNWNFNRKTLNFPPTFYNAEI